MPSVAEDVLGSAYFTNTSTTSISGSWAQSASAGDTIIAFCAIYSFGFGYPQYTRTLNFTPTGGTATPMTSLGAINADNTANASTQCWLEVFEIQNVTGGGNLSWAVSSIGGSGNPGSNSIAIAIATSDSYSGVASLGSIVTNFGLSTSLSSAAVTSQSGGLVAQAFIESSFGAAPNLGTYTGGTSRYQKALVNSSTSMQLVMGYASGASSVTITDTTSANSEWCSISVPLVPSTQITDIPGPATVTVTPGTPIVFNQAQDVVIPSPAAITVAPGAPAVIDNTVIIPAGSPIPINLDQTGTGWFVANTVTAVSGTWQQLVQAGETVIAFSAVIPAANSYTSFTRTMTCGGNPMTSMGAIDNNNTAGDGWLEVFQLGPIVTGGDLTIAWSVTSVANTNINVAAACSDSYAAVTSLGSPVFNSGLGSSLSSGTVPSQSGGMVAHAFLNYNQSAVANLQKYSGTSRHQDVLLNGFVSMQFVIGDTPGANSVTITDTTDAATFWSSIAVPMVPGVTATSPAVIPFYPGTPQVFGGPLAPAISKLLAGLSIIILGLGDSTMFSAYDTGFSEATNPWTPGTLFGWLGRDAYALGVFYQAKVQVLALNYPSVTAYSPAVTIYTPPGWNGTLTITVYLGGWPGAKIADYLAFMSVLIPEEAYDLIFIQDGFNESNLTQFGSGYTDLVNQIQNSYAPNTPVVVTTANAVTQTANGAGLTFASIFAEVLAEFLPSASLPLSPPLQASTTFNDLWVLDTQQAPITAVDLYNNGATLQGIHPVGNGYAIQGNFTIDKLSGGAIDPQLLFPTAASLTVSPGTPLAINATVVIPGSGSESVMGGTPLVLETFVDSPAPATETIVPGTPVVVDPTIDIPGTGNVQVTGSTPGISDSTLDIPVDAGVSVFGMYPNIVVRPTPPPPPSKNGGTGMLSSGFPQGGGGVIKLVEDYAVAQLRKDVRSAMMMAGEQAILLSLFHAGDSAAQPCPQCGDDIYKAPEMDCTVCYGTTFNGGVKSAMKVWSLFTDHDISEQLSPRGDYQPDQRSVTFEAFPMVTEHDVLVRVYGWNSDGTPGQLGGYYLLGKLQRRSLRTGNRFGQASWDVVSQKGQCAELPGTMHGITSYPVLGEVFAESVQFAQLNGSGLSLPASVASLIQSNGGAGKYAVTVGDGVSTTITVTHNLGTLDVGVTLYSNATGEEVEADVSHATLNTVNLRFAVAPAYGSYRCVVYG